jgi:carbonic anhydrase
VPRNLVEGLQRFRADHFPRFREHYERLVSEGQKPGALFIGCSDSRIVPDVLMGTGPGELFIVRNVGNLVPPFEPVHGYHGTSAAIEFAVLTLNVSDIVVCGHSHCGAIRALYSEKSPETPHINRWLELAHEARLDAPLDEDMLRQTEQRSVALQLSRLMEYPMVRERLEAGRLAVHGWHYIIERGEVLILDVERGEFIASG